MNWLHYLLEANLYLAVFYAGYYLFLRRETFYTLSRIYLLFGSVVSFILPVLQLGMLRPAPQHITPIHYYTYPVVPNTFVPVTVAPPAPVFTLHNAFIYGYIIGAVVLLLILLFRLYQLYRLTASQNKVVNKRYKVVYLNQSDTAFSFFNYLFIGTNANQAEMIIRHELVHIRQKHSADVIFIELLKIINWFNPFIYLMQHSLRAIHEYIADEITANGGTDTITYSSFLVNNAYGLGGSAITHSFFNYNLLKKRIIMLHQKRSGKLARLKYLLAVPVCGGLLCASTLAFSKTYGWVDIAPHHTYILPHRINPANKSLQVAEPEKILVFTNGKSTVTTSKFVLTRHNGTKKTYTAYNLSDKDREDLKKQGINLSVITVDTTKNKSKRPYVIKRDTATGKTSRPEVVSDGKTPPPPPPVPPKKPYVIKRDKAPVKIPPPAVVPDDKVPPPPPPAPSAKKVMFPLPKQFPGKTNKGYPYSEAAYSENGEQDIIVTLQEKDGSHKEFTKSTATKADLALLKDKYGYVFPAHLRRPPPPEAPAKTGAVVPKDKDRTKATALAIDTNVFKQLELIPVAFKKGKGC